MLKADFHLHTNEDPHDSWIGYSAKELIDHASELGFDVLAITNHGAVYYSKELGRYARKKGILLIPGIEAFIEKIEVVILNTTKEAEKLKTFSDLREFKRKNPDIFVLAPHPFYPKNACLGRKFFKHIDLFDGVEYCHYYCVGHNPYNKKAVRKAKEHGKSVIGTSDAHRFYQINTTFSFVDAEKDINSVINALKEGKVKVKTRPLSYYDCTRIVVPMFWHKIKDHWFHSIFKK